MLWRCPPPPELACRNCGPNWATLCGRSVTTLNCRFRMKPRQSLPGSTQSGKWSSATTEVSGRDLRPVFLPICIPSLPPSSSRPHRPSNLPAGDGCVSIDLIFFKAVGLRDDGRGADPTEPMDDTAIHAIAAGNRLGAPATSPVVGQALL